MNINDKVVIVGAGPAGLSLSILINRQDVVIYEDHGKVGLPKHCAGFVSFSVYDWFRRISSHRILDRCYDEIVIHTPKESFRFSLNNRFICRLNRPTLEEELLDKALAKGVQVFFNTRVKPQPRVGEIAVNGSIAKPKVIVAADGVTSLFRRRYLGVGNRFLYGFQWIYRARDVGEEAVHVIFSETLREFFMWAAPVLDKEFLVGYGSRVYVNPENVLKQVEKLVKVSLSTKVDFFGGLIATGVMVNKPFVNNVFFIGDSGYAVKPFTGGGLYYISKLTPPLAFSIDFENPSIYLKVWKHMRIINRLEYLFVKFFREIGYWVPAYIVAKVLKLNPREANEYVYNQHLRLALKALFYTPLIPFEEIVSAFKKLLSARAHNLS